MADFSRSLSYTLDVYKVDTTTWADLERIGMFTSASISRSDGRMVESGSFEMDTDIGKEFEEGYYRLVMRVTQDELTERYDIATLYMTSASGMVDFGVNQISVDGMSVLYPADSKVMTAGSFIPKTSDGAMYIGRLLSSTIEAPVHVEGSFKLVDDFVFDVGAKVLDCVWDILESAGWCLQIDGRGEVTVMARPNHAYVELGPNIVMPGISYTRSVADIPNRYIAIDGTKIGQCVNDDPTSPVSTVSRGFIRDLQNGIDSSPTMIDGETLDSYCRRRLKELSVVTYEFSCQHEYMHGVFPNSMVYATVQPDGTVGEVRVKSQSIKFSNEVTMDCTYIRETNLWN